MKLTNRLNNVKLILTIILHFFRDYVNDLPTEEKKESQDPRIFKAATIENRQTSDKKQEAERKEKACPLRYASEKESSVQVFPLPKQCFWLWNKDLFQEQQFTRFPLRRLNQNRGAKKSCLAEPSQKIDPGVFEK